MSQEKRAQEAEFLWKCGKHCWQQSSCSHDNSHAGIGRQCALAFVAEGCSRIALIDRDEDGMSETSRLCKETARLTRPKSTVSTFIIPCDVSLEAEVAVALDYVVEEWGRIDYAVNCAGVGGTAGPSHRQAVDEFDRVTGTNCRGTWLSARGEIIRMLDQEPLKTHDGRRGNRGVIVNVASNMGLVSRPECRKLSFGFTSLVSPSCCSAEVHASAVRVLMQSRSSLCRLQGGDSKPDKERCHRCKCSLCPGFSWMPLFLCARLNLLS